MEDVRLPARRSLSDRLWVDPDEAPGEGAVDVLSRRLEISPGIARILAGRGLHDADEAYRFLHPDETHLHPPYLMLGMEEAVQRILRALENYEKIVVFGDYDVDGTAAASIVYSYLKRLGARVHYYIPHRISDGFGFTPGTVQRLFDWKADLVITCDHGSTDVDAPALLAQHEVDLVVTDHHRFGPTVPPAAAVVNPQRPGCPYPFKELAAAGVAYKLVCALDERLEALNFWDRHGLCRTAPGYFLDLVTMATVADMAPLVGENRVLVRLGLEALNSRLKPGLSGLVKECRVRGTITPATITFKLAPKINASGRVGDPRVGMQLLISHSFTESRRLARTLVQMNRERQEIERGVYNDVLDLMEAMEDHPALILAGRNWHIGVIGSIATRLAYQTRRPTVVLTQHETQEMVGSARSSERYNVLRVLESCGALLDRFGGHPSAAGLSLQARNLEAFTRLFNAAAERDRAGPRTPEERDQLRIEAWIPPDGLEQLLEEIALLSPFGYGNPEPVLGVRGFQLRNPSVFNNRHLKFHLACGDGRLLDAYAWDHSDWEVCTSDRYDMALMPQVQGPPADPRVQLRVVDLKCSG